MSSWTNAISAAPSIVMPPTIPTIWSTTGSASMNTKNRRPTRYTPAATIVAAWISAETGVGPAIASGSQTWSGNCADLPIVPPNSSSAAADTSATDAPPTRDDVADRRDVRGGEARDEHQDEDPEHERDVADPGRDERLDRRAGVDVVLPPVPDQQVGADAHDLPPDEELEQVVREDHDEHRAREQRQDDVEPREADVALHVAERVHVDAQRDRRHDDDHHRRETVDVHAGLQVELADLEPRHRRLVEAVLAPDEGPQNAERQHERSADGRDPVDGPLARGPLADEQRQHRGHRRQEGDQPGVPEEGARVRDGPDELRRLGGYHLRRFTSSTLIVSRLR